MQKHSKILIIEDDTLVAENIKAQSQEWGHDICGIVTTGEKALQLLEGTCPDIVLVDIVLPGKIDGIEVAKIINEKYGIPIVFITSYSDQEKIRRAKTVQPYGYLIKPVNSHELNITIEMALYKGQIDRKLLEYQRWSQAVFHSIEDGVITTNRQGTINFVNPKAESILKQANIEYTGKKLADIIKLNPPKTHKAFETTITSLLEKGNSPSNNFTAKLQKKGHSLPIDISISGIKYDNNTSDGLVFTFRDVSLLHNANSKLEKYNEELEAFSYSVAHDLRAPLRSVCGFCQILKEEASNKLSIVEQDYLHRTIRASQYMADLIDDLLKLSKISRSEVTRDSVNLTDMAKEIVEQLHQTQKIRHVNWLIEDNLFAFGDSSLMKIALENLLGNAWKYTSKNQSAKIEFGSKREHMQTIYYIKDDGAGFDMRYADKLFGVFQRLHKNDEFEGTGIGLATVNRIIQRHEGRIWATSEENKGSTFYFTLNEM